MCNIRKSTQLTGLDFLLLNNTQRLWGHYILILREKASALQKQLKKKQQYLLNACYMPGNLLEVRYCFNLKINQLLLQHFKNKSLTSHKVQKPQVGIDEIRLAWNIASCLDHIFQTFSFEKKLANYFSLLFCTCGLFQRQFSRLHFIHSQLNYIQH